MKKTIYVTIEKEIEIDIDDSCLTTEALAEFESGMFSLSYEGDTHATMQSELFKHVARVCFEDDSVFVEGVGEARPTRYLIKPETRVLFDVVYEDIVTEICPEGAV